MKNSNLKIIKTIKETEVEFFTNFYLEPNSSYEIDNCVREIIKPTEFAYRLDIWFDNNDSGHFVKDDLRVEISYGVMKDFCFTASKDYTEAELDKIENWIIKIYTCMLEKEKIRLDEKAKEKADPLVEAPKSKADIVKKNWFSRIFGLKNT
jgi:hypothetical protein